MATAIGENASALSDRAEVEAAIREENDRLAHEFVRLKKDGLVTDLVPVADIKTDKLVRDRVDRRDPEIDELKASIKEIGLSNAIRVEATDDGYQLIQGFRRLNAFKELFAETGEEMYARIPAGLVARGEALEGLYRKMVDENLVRRDISFAEMAELARSYAANPDTVAADVQAAISILFASAGRQKRNYIGHFARLLELIGDSLSFPEAIPRSLGLQLEKRLAADPKLVRRVQAVLKSGPSSTAAKEIETLRGFLGSPAVNAAVEGREPKPSAKTSIRYEGPDGMVRCTASEGRIEIRAPKDFTGLDRRQLEAALEQFFQALRD